MLNIHKYIKSNNTTFNILHILMPRLTRANYLNTNCSREKLSLVGFASHNSMVDPAFPK